MATASGSEFFDKDVKRVVVGGDLQVKTSITDNNVFDARTKIRSDIAEQKAPSKNYKMLLIACAIVGAFLLYRFTR
jgi:hypothetical protein